MLAWLPPAMRTQAAGRRYRVKFSAAERHQLRSVQKQRARIVEPVHP